MSPFSNSDQASVTTTASMVGVRPMSCATSVTTAPWAPWCSRGRRQRRSGNRSQRHVPPSAGRPGRPGHPRPMPAVRQVHRWSSRADHHGSSTCGFLEPNDESRRQLVVDSATLPCVCQERLIDDMGQRRPGDTSSSNPVNVPTCTSAGVKESDGHRSILSPCPGGPVTPGRWNRDLTFR